MYKALFEPQNEKMGREKSRKLGGYCQEQLQLVGQQDDQQVKVLIAMSYELGLTPKNHVMGGLPQVVLTAI